MAEEKKLRHLIRLGEADLPGDKSIYHALRRIKGVSYSLSNAVLKTLKIDKNIKVNDLKKEDLDRIKEVIDNPKKFKIYTWLLNRRRDYDTGEDLHLTGSQLNLRKQFDVKRLIGIRSYRGMRHATNQPVRGQRTRSHFRKGAAVGVKRKKGKK